MGYETPDHGWRIGLCQQRDSILVLHHGCKFHGCGMIVFQCTFQHLEGNKNDMSLVSLPKLIQRCSQLPLPPFGCLFIAPVAHADSKQGRLRGVDAVRFQDVSRQRRSNGKVERGIRHDINFFFRDSQGNQYVFGLWIADRANVGQIECPAGQTPAFLGGDRADADRIHHKGFLIQSSQHADGAIKRNSPVRGRKRRSFWHPPVILE